MFASDVDNCCKITVSKSERDLFISAFGLSFSLPPVQLTKATLKSIFLLDGHIGIQIAFTCNICLVFWLFRISQYR